MNFHLKATLWMVDTGKMKRLSNFSSYHYICKASMDKSRNNWYREREAKLTSPTILVGDGPAEFKLSLVMFPLTGCRQSVEFWVTQKQTKGSRLWNILISYLALYKCRTGGYFYFLESSPARRNRKWMSIGSEGIIPKRLILGLIKLMYSQYPF